MKMLWSIMANRVEMRMGPDGLPGLSLGNKGFALYLLFSFVERKGDYPWGPESQVYGPVWPCFHIGFLGYVTLLPQSLFLVVLEWEACSHRIQSLGLPLLAKVLFLEVNLYAIWCSVTKPCQSIFLLSSVVNKLRSKGLLRYCNWFPLSFWKSVITLALVWDSSLCVCEMTV